MITPSLRWRRSWATGRERSRMFATLQSHVFADSLAPEKRTMTKQG
jgi:hypothetical protein